MALFGNWSGYPIVGWSFDDQEKLIEAIKKFKDDGRSTPTAADYGQKEYDEEIKRVDSYTEPELDSFFTNRYKQ